MDDQEKLPFKSENKKAKLNSIETFWIIIFSVILAIVYTYVNIS